MSTRRTLLFVVCGGLLGAFASAQTSTGSQPAPAQSAVNVLVAQLIENANRYRTALPSLEAHESIVSDGAIGFFYKPHATAEATVRVAYRQGGGLIEARSYTAHNGRPVAAGTKVELPTYIGNDLGNQQGYFFSSIGHECFDFILARADEPGSPIELRIAPLADFKSRPQCHFVPEGLTGFARVDSATHQLTHIERTVPNGPGEPSIRVLFESIDYAPARVGDSTYWLPTSITETAVNNKFKYKGHFVVRYSDYHQFAASSTVVPAQ